MAKKTADIAVTVKGIPLEFSRPTVKRWTRYLEKQRKGERSIAARELAQTCCYNVSRDDIGKVLAKAPAAVKAIADALEALCLGDCEAALGDDSVTLTGTGFDDIVLRCPTMDEWESFQNVMVEGKEYMHDATMELIKPLAEDQSEELVAAVVKYPALALASFSQVSLLAGAEVEIVVKKQ